MRRMQFGPDLPPPGDDKPKRLILLAALLLAACPAFAIQDGQDPMNSGRITTLECKLYAGVDGNYHSTCDPISLTVTDPSTPEADDDDPPTLEDEADDANPMSACTKPKKCAKEAVKTCRDLGAEVESVTFNAADHTCNTTCVTRGNALAPRRYVVAIVCVRAQ